jgi:hypothetical protein
MFKVFLFVLCFSLVSFSGDGSVVMNRRVPAIDVSGFGDAEAAYKASVEKKRLDDSIALDRAKKDPVAVPSANVSMRMVTIDPKSPEGIVIDQFDRDIAAVRSLLYSNVLYKKTAEMDCDDQIRYMHWLLLNKYQDTTSVVRACERLCLIYQIESEKLTVVRSAAGENSRGSIQAHIRKAWDCMGKISALILLLSDEVGVR